MSRRAAPVVALAAFHLAFFARAYLSRDTFYLRDFSLVQVPVKSIALQALREGALPLWIPSLSGGQPLLANPNYFTFHPANVLPLALGVLPGLKLFVLLQYALASAGGYLLARHLGLGRIAAILFATGFAHGGFLSALGNLINSLAAAALLPFLLLAALRTARDGWPFLPAVAVIAAVQLFGGEPVPALLSFALALGMAAVAGGPRALARTAIGVVLGALIASPQVIPAVVFYFHSDRHGGLGATQALKWSLPPIRIAELLLPRLLGSPAEGVPPGYLGAAFEDGGYPYIISVFVGPVALVLAAVGALRRRPARALVALALAAIVLALGHHTPLGAFVHGLVPGAAIFRYPSKLMLWAAAALPLAAAYGLDEIARDRRDGLVACGLGGLAAAFALAMAAPRLTTRVVASATGEGMPWWRDDVLAGLMAHAFIIMAILMLASLLLLVRGRSMGTPGGIATVLAIVHVVTLLAFMPSLLPLVSPAFYAEVPPPLQPILSRSHDGPFRIYWEPAEGPMAYPLRSGHSRELALAQRRLGREHVGRSFGLEYAFETGWEGVALASIRRGCAELEALSWAEKRPLLDRANVRYVISFAPHPDLVPLATLSGLERRPIHVYENPSAWPRVTGGRLRSYGPDHYVIDVDPHPSRNPVDFAPTHPSHASEVRISANAYPLWRAEADGRAVPLAGGSGASEVRVRLPPGTRTLTVTLDPWDVRLGFGLSAAGLLGCVVAGRRRPRP